VKSTEATSARGKDYNHSRTAIRHLLTRGASFAGMTSGSSLAGARRNWGAFCRDQYAPGRLVTVLFDKSANGWPDTGFRILVDGRQISQEEIRCGA